MGPDERDRKFDKALSRHLRSVAPSGAAANSHGGAASERGSCPDLESLAAYHERSLLSEEMNSFKEHIVGCAHCQSILAQLEATDEIPLQAATQEELLALKESQSVLAAQGHETLPATVAISQGAAAPPKQAGEIRHFPGLRWKWLAPAGALAAGLLVWIAIHENQPSILPHANEVKVASNQSHVSPSPSASTGAIQAIPAPSQPALKKQSEKNEIASANATAASGAADLRRRNWEYMTPRALPPKTLADKGAATRKDAPRETSADALTAATAQPDLDAKNVPATTQTVEVQAEAQRLIVQQQSQSGANLHRSDSTGQADSAKKMKAPSAAPPPAPPQAKVPAPAPAPTASGGVAGFTSATSMAVRISSNPRLIAVPGSKAIWRVGRSGLIESSSDSGNSWSRQTSGATADLITGSAPSEQVCWVVGLSGTVLLTTDAGAHWRLLSAPMPDDLGGVQATDALHARVWNSLNTKSFETSDGGVTWKRFVNE